MLASALRQLVGGVVGLIVGLVARLGLGLEFMIGIANDYLMYQRYLPRLFYGFGLCALGCMLGILVATLSRPR